MASKYSIVQACRIGARQSNQDRVGHSASDAAVLMVVADGMGGHPRGELAAQLAVDQLVEDFAREAQPRIARPESFLQASFNRAHWRIIREARALRLPDEPRTVLVACVVQDGAVTWLHVGDSRFYLLRRGAVAVRSRDDSFIQQLVDMGWLREEDAGFHPDRNIVVRCVGGSEPLRLRPAQSIALEARDVVLLCSDGFWGPLAPDELAEDLPGRDLEAEVVRLVERAEQRAGVQCDNVSAVALVWKERRRRAGAAQRAAPADDLPTEA
ncbi:MAG: protein phosphatase 2C domain-containing protein [Burkholderiales bacterium]|nr:protein phosphatase 2C domain-containing protein [Burkholderiales bacterium]